jgi:TolB-like protein/DNA-binding SARP family transcriptional activator
MIFAEGSMPMDGSRLLRLRVNDRTIDFQRGLVTNASGQAITLRPQAAAVLRILAAQPGVLITKDQLMRAVWPDISVTDDSLVQCVKEIRRALGDESHQVITTLVKRGYIFEAVAELERDMPSATMDAPMAATTATASTPPSGERLPSVAVLPFDDMSADSKLGYMGDSVAEDIIAMLARSPDVIVVARNSSFTYRGQAADIRKVGRDLGVDYVLEGSVRKEADKLRIVAQLSESKTGQHLWAERFDKTGSDLWVLQDEVTASIIASLAGELGQFKQAQYREAWGKEPSDLTEYDYYLRGHEFFSKLESREGNERAGEIWNEGLSKFPHSMLLKVYLGWYYFRAGWAFWRDMPTNLRQASRTVREVLAEDHLTRQVKRHAHWLFAFVLMQEGDFEGALAQTKIAIAMGPHDAVAIVAMVEVLTAAGRYEQALEWLATGEAKDPSRRAKYHSDRGALYRLMGRYEDSIQEYRQAGPLRPWFRLSSAISYVRLGRMHEAETIVREILAQHPEFNLDIWRQGNAHSDPSILDEEVHDLARAGLPAE